jgi:hypothetical protein
MHELWSGTDSLTQSAWTAAAVPRIVAHAGAAERADAG